MRLRSVYEIDCPCGKHIVTETTTVKCDCVRLLELHWRAELEPKPPADRKEIVA